MIYTEIKGNLFSEDDTFKFAQCISADLAMGKGIAVAFNEKFDTKNMMHKAYTNTTLSEWDAIPAGKRGMCKYAPPVLNLITKRRYFEKPTLITMENALNDMKSLCLHYGIGKIAMPKIGCGLDRLSWDNVSKLIKKTFEDTDIEIHIWYM